MPPATLSLYETLLGHFEGELPIAQVPAHEHAWLSVLDNLQRILRSRAGSLAHLPDYGVPDSGLLVGSAAAVAQQVQVHLQATLLRYEPRLRSLEVTALAPAQAGELRFALVVQLRSGEYGRLLGSRSSDGRFLLRHLREQGLYEGRL